MVALLSKPHEPQGKERQAILLATKRVVEKELGSPILMQTRSMIDCEGYCFFEFRPNAAKGGPFLWKYSKHAKAPSSEDFMNEVLVILKKGPKGWKVLEAAYGPTSDDWLNWPAKYHAPKSILPG